MEKTIAVAERLRDLFRGHYAFAALSATRPTRHTEAFPARRVAL